MNGNVSGHMVVVLFICFDSISCCHFHISDDWSRDRTLKFSRSFRLFTGKRFERTHRIVRRSIGWKLFTHQGQHKNEEQNLRIWGFAFFSRPVSWFVFFCFSTHQRTTRGKKQTSSPLSPGKKLFSQPLAKLIKKRMVILLLLLFTKWRRRGRKRRRRGAIVGSCEVPHGSTWTECRQSGTSRRDS